MFAHLPVEPYAPAETFFSVRGESGRRVVMCRSTGDSDSPLRWFCSQHDGAQCYDINQARDYLERLIAWKAEWGRNIHAFDREADAISRESVFAVR